LLLPVMVGLVALAGSLVAAHYRRSLTEPMTVLLATATSLIVAGVVWIVGRGRSRALDLASSATRELRDSEERFRSLAASSPVGIFQTGVDGELEYVNQRFADVADLDPDEPLCEDWLCIAHPEDQPALRAGWRQALASGTEFSARFRVPTRAGPVHWLQVQAAPLHELAAGPSGWVGSVQNITDQVLAFELRQRLADIVESSADAILATELDGTIASWNPGAERLFGWRSDEVEGGPVSVLAPEEGPDAISAALDRVLLQRVSERYEAVVATRDGRRLEVSLTTSPTTEPGGRLIGTSTIARDVTERKRAERELAVTAAALEAHTAELERSNAELAQFAYVASHDLSEPLRMVSSYVQLLAKRYTGRLDSDADEFIAFAVDGADRMQALINALLAYSRVGRGGLERRRVAFDDVLRRVLRNLTASLEETGGRVVAEGELPVVAGDQTQLEQLLQNLISNSLKFTRAGVEPLITVRAEREASAWRFDVADNGIGIEPRHAERIFNMFQRLNARQEFPGTGIGLSICRKIAELHGGRIWVEPNPGGGSRFSFTVADAPLGPPAERPAIRPAETVAS
jgi:PAS domain S-box-containing protein